MLCFFAMLARCVVLAWQSWVGGAVVVVRSAFGEKQSEQAGGCHEFAGPRAKMSMWLGTSVC